MINLQYCHSNSPAALRAARARATCVSSSGADLGAPQDERTAGSCVRQSSHSAGLCLCLIACRVVLQLLVARSGCTPNPRRRAPSLDERPPRALVARRQQLPRRTGQRLPGKLQQVAASLAVRPRQRSLDVGQGEPLEERRLLTECHEIFEAAQPRQHDGKILPGHLALGLLIRVPKRASPRGTLWRPHPAADQTPL